MAGSTSMTSRFMSMIILHFGWFIAVDIYYLLSVQAELELIHMTVFPAIKDELE